MELYIYFPLRFHSVGRGNYYFFPRYRGSCLNREHLWLLFRRRRVRHSAVTQFSLKRFPRFLSSCTKMHVQYIKVNLSSIHYSLILLLFNNRPPLVCRGLLVVDASRSHSDTPHSVELLWKSNQPDTETSTG